jgi:hypothetical protein
MKSHLSFLGVVILFSVGLVGCNTAPTATVSMNYFADKKYDPKPASSPVQIILKDTNKPHIVLGHISASEREFWAGVNDSDGNLAMAKIKAKVRQLGGDAVIKFKSYTGLRGTTGEGTFTAQGTVVRWK